MAEGLAALLNDHPDLQVTGIAYTVAEAIEAAGTQPIDAVVVDFWLPDGSGPEAATGIRRHQPDVIVIFLSADDSDSAVIAAVEAGASGYLMKTASGQDIAEAVRRAMEGETLIPATRLASLLARRAELAQREAERDRTLTALTPRELQVLDLMSKGRDNREIADHLTVSYATVRSHVRKVLEKLGARSKLEAVVKAADIRLLEQPPPESRSPESSSPDGTSPGDSDTSPAL